MRHEPEVAVAPGSERRPEAPLDVVDERRDKRAPLRVEVLKRRAVEAVRDELFDVFPQDLGSRGAAEPAREEVVEGDDVGEGEEALYFLYEFFILSA